MLFRSPTLSTATGSLLWTVLTRETDLWTASPKPCQGEEKDAGRRERLDGVRVEIWREPQFFLGRAEVKRPKGGGAARSDTPKFKLEEGTGLFLCGLLGGWRKERSHHLSQGEDTTASLSGTKQLCNVVCVCVCVCVCMGGSSWHAQLKSALISMG